MCDLLETSLNTIFLWKKWGFVKFGGFTSQLCFAVQQSIFIEFQRSYHQNFRFFSNFLNLLKTLIFCHFWFKFGQISTKNVFFEVGNFICPNFSQKERKSKKFKNFRKIKQTLTFGGYKHWNPRNRTQVIILWINDVT